ncbi:nuclear transport factor 2 family protein [Actinokineospora sp. G85]|uniref:nuclear transport factor 2 family protein n=1 Tax=Actinokineospora sp. G85 TaxID=3406626 RepID=UPI003C773262
MIDEREDKTADLYSQVQTFYARQMALLDNGDGDAWADTYTEDAVFSETRMPAPLLGREAIRTSVRKSVARHEETQRVFRHWFGMLTVDPQDDGSLRTRCYALTLTTPHGGGTPTPLGHAVLEDHLVPGGPHGWLVHHRTITPDGV